MALELSTNVGSVAVRDDAGQIFGREFANDRKHSGVFFETLQTAHACCRTPEGIVVGLGPGSYAGVRIAISAAIGLHLPTSAELIGLPSICAMETGEPRFHVIGDARRQSFFFATIANGECVEGPLLLGEAALRERMRESSSPVYSAEPLPQFPATTLAHPSASKLAEFAINHPNRTSPPLEPLYLREPHITASKQPVWKPQS